MTDGIQHAEQLRSTVSLPKFGKCPGGPDGGMGVLPAIFTHTRADSL